MSCNKKLVGCCSVCDVPVFEIREVYPQGHDYAGEPRKVGNPKDNAWRVTILLSSGDHIDLTMCRECLEAENLNLNMMWSRIREGWAQEMTDKNCKVLQKPVYTDKQKTQLDEYLYRMCQMSVLGILCKRPWRYAKDA